MLDSKDDIRVDLKFALPGKERQDSVYSGLEVLLLVSCLYLDRNLSLVYIFPLLSSSVILRLIFCTEMTVLPAIG